MFAQFPQAHAEVVTSLTFSPHQSSPFANALCSTSGDDSAALWDIQGGVNLLRLQGHHRGPVNHALFLPTDAHALLTAADDRTIALWDLRLPGRPVAQLTGFHDGVNKMLLLPASVFLNCGLPSTTTAAATMLGLQQQPQPQQLQVDSSAELLVASACDDGRVYVHALVTAGLDVSSSATAAALPSAGPLVDCFWASTSTVNDLVQTPDPRVVLTASEDGALRTWRLLFNPNAPTEERLLCSLDEFENPVNHIAVVPHGMLYTESAPGAGSAQPQLQQRGSEEDDEEDGGGAGGSPENSNGTAATTTTTTTTAATTTYGEGGASGPSHTDQSDPQQREEEERNGLRRWVLAACSEFIFGVDLVVASGEFGSGARSFVGHNDYVRGLEFTRAGTLLTVSDDSTVMEWSLATGEPLRQVKLHEGLVMASAQNAAGDALATGTDRGEIRVWRLPFQTERMGS